MIDEPTLSDADNRLLRALEQLPPVARPDDLHARFRERLHADLLLQRRPRRWLVPALAALLILALGGGWWTDRVRHESEVSQLRAQLISALNDMSAPRRFEAVSLAGNSPLRDDRVVAALTRALLTDPNTNVRVAAAEALGRVADSHALADAATRSFGHEVSPFVQSELLRSVDRLDAAERRRIVSPLLDRRGIDPAVRIEATRLSEL